MELLSPCGSKDAFFAAINGGADAVYLGLEDFSARKNAENFSRENVAFYLDYAHLYGVKVYVALNTLISESETERFLSFVSFCSEAGVDGIILQNLFWGKFLKEKFPFLPLHLSTQAGVNNVDGAILAKKFGFSRVVVARETPLSEIKKIAAVIETECFIQGALCSSFSGQCYMSSFAGNLSGNRGECKQPCRKRYTLSSDSFSTEGYCISLSDLCVSRSVGDLIAAGVTSFKIEGRMRKSAFVAAATQYYRALLDGKNPSISPLKRSFNRGDYTSGLAFGQDQNFISDKIQSHKGERVGRITRVKNGFCTVDGTHEFTNGDGAKIVRDGLEVGSLVARKDGLKVFGNAKAGDLVYLTTDVRAENTSLSLKRLLPVAVEARLIAGEIPVLTAKCRGVSVTVEGENALTLAKTAPLKKEDVEKTLAKTDKYPFAVSASVETAGAFMPLSALNALRRGLYEKLYSSLTRKKTRNVSDITVSEYLSRIPENRSCGIVVLDDEFAFPLPTAVTHAVLCPADYGDDRVIEGFFDRQKASRAEKYLYIPCKFSSSDEESVSRLIPKFDGLYVEGTFGVELAARYGKKLILGTGANVYDPLSAKIAATFCDGVCLSKELAITDAEKLDGFYYAAGAIKVMDLIYCPFKKTCDDCKGSDRSTLFDGERKFTIRRVRLNGCRFEVYNGASLTTLRRDNAVINLVGLKTKIKPQVIAALGDKKKLNELMPDHTSGHENKPLI